MKGEKGLGHAFRSKIRNLVDPQSESPTMRRTKSERRESPNRSVERRRKAISDGNEGCPHLVKVARQGTTALVDFLLERGADIEATDRFGVTALMAASSNGHLQTVQRLIKAGADLAARCQVSSGGRDGGDTALHFASLHGHPLVVQTLLKAGASMSATTNRGLTPLHSASKRGHAPAILLLAAAGSDKGGQDEDGLSAVHHATLGNRLAALVTLIQLGAPTNLRSNAGRTPLAQARHDDHEELVTLLSGAHKLQWTKQGREALVRARQEGNKAVVRLLLAASGQATSMDGTAASMTKQDLQFSVKKLTRSMSTPTAMERKQGKDIDHLLPSRLRAPALLAPPKV